MYRAPCVHTGDRPGGVVAQAHPAALASGRVLAQLRPPQPGYAPGTAPPSRPPTFRGVLPCSNVMLPLMCLKTQHPLWDRVLSQEVAALELHLSRRSSFSDEESSQCILISSCFESLECPLADKLHAQVPCKALELSGKAADADKRVQGGQRALPAIAPGCWGVVTPELPLPDFFSLCCTLNSVVHCARLHAKRWSRRERRRTRTSGCWAYSARCRPACRATGESCVAAAWRAYWPPLSWPASMLTSGTLPRCCSASTACAQHVSMRSIGDQPTGAQWVVVYVWYCFRACRQCSHSFVRTLSSCLSLSTFLCTSLREFELYSCAGRDLSTARQEALQATLEAAAKQMNAEERQRPGPGPPPLLAFVRALALPAALRPRPVAIAPSNGSSSEGLEAGRLPGSVSPFIYNPSRVCAFSSAMPRDA